MGGTLRRIDELLLARATEGLSDADARELARLLVAHPDVDAAEYERAAAAVSLASLAELPAMPKHLRAALDRRAAEFIAQLDKRPR